MALGTDDEKAARRTHLLGLLCNGSLVLGQRLLEFLAHGQNFGVGRLSVGIGLGDQLLGQLLLAQLGQRQIFCVAAEHNVGATTSHIGGDGHRTELTGLRNDLGLALMVLGIQDGVRHALALQELRQQLGFFDGDRTDQHGLPLLVAALDLLDDRAELARLGLVDHVVVVDTDDRLICRDLDDVKVINRGKLFLLGQRRAGHAGELFIKAEQILERNGRKCLIFAGDVHAFLGLDGLMQALIIAAAVHQSPGEFIDDDDLTVLDDVVDVAFHNAARLHCLIDMVRKRGILHVREVVHAEVLLGLGDAGGRERDGAGLFIDVVVAVQIVLNFLFVRGGKDLLAQTGDKAVGHFIELGGFLSLAGDNQRRSGLVDQDRVHLVHDNEIVPALHHVALVKCHVVAQIVEA